MRFDPKNLKPGDTIPEIRDSFYLNEKWRLFGELPVTFTSVRGDFRVPNQNLTSMKGFPYYVTGTLDASLNRISSMQHLKVVAINGINLQYNHIRSLEGMQVSGNRLGYIQLEYNPLDSLEGLDQKYTGSIYFSTMDKSKFKFSTRGATDRLASLHISSVDMPVLEGMPKSFGSLNIKYTTLSTLEGSPEEILGSLYLMRNENLKSYDGGPKIVSGSCTLPDSFIESGELPKYVGGDLIFALDERFQRGRIEEHKRIVAEKVKVEGRVSFV